MTLEPSKILALCFDVDGTLRDTDDRWVQGLAKMLRPVNYLYDQADPQVIARRLIMALEDPATWLYSLPDRLNVDHHLAVVSDWLYRAGIGRQRGEFLLVAGVKEMLEALSSEYRMSVVSARGLRGTEAFLDHCELTQYFQAVAGSQSCRHTKPFPDPILWAAEKMGVPPESCLVIGDTVVDMRAGKAAGAQTVGVLCGFGKRGELLNAGADLILNSTAELSSVLLGEY